MAHTFEFVLHFVRCDTVTVSPNLIIIIIYTYLTLMKLLRSEQFEIAHITSVIECSSGFWKLNGIKVQQYIDHNGQKMLNFE